MSKTRAYAIVIGRSLLKHYHNEIRRIITLSTPHYGVSLAEQNKYLNGFRGIGVADCSETQSSELRFGSDFVWRLHFAWYQARPSADILFVAGTQDVDGSVFECNLQGCDDGLVQVSSAVLPDATDDRARYLPYKHADIIPFGNGQTIASVSDKSKKNYELVKNFLADNVVMPQCCGDDTLDYRPPFQRHDQGENEGLVLMRLVSTQTGLPVTLGKYGSNFALNFRPSPGWYSDQANNNEGSITIWGITENNYTVTFRAQKFRPSEFEVQTQTARPIVLPYVYVTPR